MRLGRVPDVMLMPDGLMVMPTWPEVLPAGLPESVTPTVTVLEPGVVGVPLTTHPAPRVRPAGSEPAVIVQV